MEQAQKECCPTFHPEKWDGKVFEWRDKKFIKASVPTFFHIPLPSMIGKRITKMTKLAEDAQKLDQNREDTLLLFVDPTAFRSDMYLSVTDVVPKATNTTLTGTFITQVFDGPYKAIPKFMKQMEADLEKKGKEVKGFYVHYGYCPKCAKEKGNNYMILFAKVD